MTAPPRRLGRCAVISIVSEPAARCAGVGQRPGEGADYRAVCTCDEAAMERARPSPRTQRTTLVRVFEFPPSHSDSSVAFGGFRGSRLSLRISRPLGSRSLGLTPTLHTSVNATLSANIFPFSSLSLSYIISTVRSSTMSLPYVRYTARAECYPLEI